MTELLGPFILLPTPWSWSFIEKGLVLPPILTSRGPNSARHVSKGSFAPLSRFFTTVSTLPSTPKERLNGAQVREWESSSESQIRRHGDRLPRSSLASRARARTCAVTCLT